MIETELEHEIIMKEDVPELEQLKPKTMSERLCDLLVDLPTDQAVRLKCKSYSEAKDMRAWAYQAAGRFKRSGSKFSIKTTIVPGEELSPKRQEAYQRCKGKGSFKWLHHIYIWKEEIGEVEHESHIQSWS